MSEAEEDHVADDSEIRNEADLYSRHKKNKNGIGDSGGGMDDFIDEDGAMADLQCMLANALMDSEKVEEVVDEVEESTFCESKI